ncbi:MAG: AsmA-like C-terminal region-containing protein [Halieaceae bacterium]|jgi:hypothetical protein|nr:AsmA-like C-terminal region-containing protein [Halieaceae bacterium]
MRRLLLAITAVLLAAIAALLLALRSQSFVLGAAHWAVEAFSDLRLELVNPDIDVYAGELSADQIHLIPRGVDGPALLSVLDFATQRGFIAPSGESRRGLSAQAASVLIYVSDSDSASNPQPMQWLGYLRWLPAQLQIGLVHLVTASANTWIFPLQELRGERLQGGNYRLTAGAAYDGEPLEATLEVLAVDAGPGVTAAQTTIRLLAPVSGSEFTLTGELDGSDRYFQYKLQVNAFYRDVRELLKGFEDSADIAGQLRLQGTMAGDTSGFVLSDATFLLDNFPEYGFQAGGWLDYRVSGETALELEANGEMASVTYLVDWLDLDLGELGAVKSNIHLTGSLDKPVIEAFSLTSGSAEGLTVNISGRLNLYDAWQDSDSRENTLEFAMEGPSLAVLQRWLGELPYDPGAWRASGRLSGYRDQLSVRDVLVEAGAPETVEIRATGEVGSVRRAPQPAENYMFEDIRFRLQAHARDSAAVGALLQLDTIPPYHELTAAVNISGRGEELRLDGGELVISASDLDARTGPISAVFHPGGPNMLTGLSAPVLVELSDVAALSRYVSRPVPALGPLRLTAVLAQEGELFQLQDVLGLIGEDDMKIELKGLVGDLATLSKVSLTGNLAGVDTRTLLAALLPDFGYADPLGKLGGTFKLADRDGAWTLSGLSLVSGTDQTPLQFAVDGSIADVTGKLSADLDARFRLGDSALIEALVGIALKPVSGSLVLATSPGQLRSTLRAQVGETRINGDGLIRVAQEGVQAVSLNLDTPHLHLQDFAAEESRDEEPVNTAPTAKDPTNPLLRLRERTPLYPVDISLTADEISGGLSSFDSLMIKLSGNDMRYTLEQFSARYNQAQTELRGVIDLNPDPPAMSLAGQSSALPLGALLRDLGIAFNVSGTLTVLGGVTLMGDTSAALVENLNGSVAFALENAVVEGAAYDLLATDLLAWIYSGALAEKSTYIDCTMARFQLRQGVASSDSLYIESAKMLATGSAEFDLVKRRMDLRITPMSKSRLLQVPSEIRLKGKMSNPRADISPVSAVADATSAALMLIPSLTLKLFGVDTYSDRGQRPCQAKLGN